MLCAAYNYSLPLRTAVITLAAFCLAANVTAQTRDASSTTSTLNPDALVRAVIQNEIEAQMHDEALWCYRVHQQEDGKPGKTLEVCQTKDGDLERLTAINGRELNSEQTQAEDQRIQQAIDHPEQLRAKKRKAREDGEQQRNLMRTFLEAFLFQCENESGNLVTLHFRPNPAFHPSNRASTVFHHLEGTLIVDPRQNRLVEINGRLTSEVRFAGGLLGHLDKNGTFLVKQKDFGEGHWDLSYLKIHISGKALFLKTINVLEEKTVLDYQPLPLGASLQQAADFLTRSLDVHTTTSASGK